MRDFDTPGSGAVDFILVCSEFGQSLEFYTRQMGFRLELIYPADDPRVVELSGFEIRIRLQRESAPVKTAALCRRSIIVQQYSANSWGEGRAGMQYRDLVPGRFGGRYIASHIRIPRGGPVADYVHHHHIHFQMIYCYQGWVRVVYEDQGDSFVMHPGDCVLQPPHIRHRVLESSDGMEVIEIGSPAEHETRVDHDLELPNTTVNRSRKFDGQRFVFHQVNTANWIPGPGTGFENRDTGIARATGNLAAAVVLRSSGPLPAQSFIHGAEFQFNFLLRGTAGLRTSRTGSFRLNPADSFVIPTNEPYVLSDVSPDFELLQVSLPGHRSMLTQPGEAGDSA